VAFAPDDVSKRYAPIVLRPIGGGQALRNNLELAWTYLADPCLQEPVLVGGRTLVEPGKELALTWQEEWWAEVPSGKQSRRPVGKWMNGLGLRAWAPILSSITEIRVIGAAEEHHRLTVRASEFARMTRDRLIAASFAAGLAPREIGSLAGISRRRVDQLLSEEHRRAQVRPASVTDLRDAVTPRDLDALRAEIEAARLDLEAMIDRERRSRQQRREAHQNVAALGFSQREIGELLGISKPRVQQLRGRVGPLLLEAS
jgi:DNA-binding CsgD family transcriptional regulator